jgi:AcrR family transcriptional regulator
VSRAAADGPWEHLLPTPDSSKVDRFHRVAWAVAVGLLRGGPLRVADVARRANVSRPWIYKYLGAEPDGLIQFAVRTYAEAFGAPVAGPLDSVELLRQGTLEGLDDALLAPWCVLVFFRGRHARGALGDAIRAALRRQAVELAARLPGASRGDVGVAVLFEAARLSLYHEWLDPEVRTAIDPERAVERLLRLVA